MSRSHRIWSDVHADNYSTSKSFGGEFRQAISVGNSALYSNAFATVKVCEQSLPTEHWTVFTLFVDGCMFKRAVFNNKTKAYAEVVDGQCCDDAIVRLES